MRRLILCLAVMLAIALPALAAGPTTNQLLSYDGLGVNPQVMLGPGAARNTDTANGSFYFIVGGDYPEGPIDLERGSFTFMPQHFGAGAVKPECMFQVNYNSLMDVRRSLQEWTENRTIFASFYTKDSFGNWTVQVYFTYLFHPGDAWNIFFDCHPKV